MNKTRLESLSDGIFAIVITLLALEIKVPEISQFSDGELLYKLLSLWPIFLAYTITFLILSRFWLIHHFLFTLGAQNINQKLININFLFFAFLVLIPFSTHLLGNYPLSKIAISVYAINIIIMNIITYKTREYIYKSPDIQNPQLHEINIDPIDMLYGVVRVALGVVMCLVAMLMSLANPYIALAILFVQGVVLGIPGTVAWITCFLGLDKKYHKNH